MSAFGALAHHIVEIQNALAELCQKHNAHSQTNLSDAAAYLKDPIKNAAKRQAWLDFMAALNKAPIGGLKLEERQLVQMLLQLLVKGGGGKGSEINESLQTLENAKTGISHADHVVVPTPSPLYEPG